MANVLERFGPATQDWFRGAFAQPTTAQTGAWEAIGAGGEPKDVIVTLGYAGWAAGQLEQELLDNAWLTVPADLGIVFELPPEERLVAAMQKLGIDFTNLSDVAGHA